MSLLFPRLLAAQAAPLFHEYRDLSVDELSARSTTTHEAAVYVATGGDRVNTAQLRNLRDSVVDLARRSGFPHAATRGGNTEFDLQLAALLHAETGMVPAEAASRDVWAFLALVLLPDVAYWRYPHPPRDRVLGTDLTRHVFGRLWWRAHLVRDPEAVAPYAALDILGEAAFDQIYARRAALGGSSHMVRAILRVWDRLDLRGVGERDALRDFLKRLLRLAPFVLFDGVEEHALDAELRAVADETVEVLLKAQAKSAETTTSQTPPLPSGTSAADALVSVSRDVRRELRAAMPESRSNGPAAAGSLLPDQPFNVHVADGSSLSGRFAPRLRPGLRSPRFIELYAGCGAQALGLERAGFVPALLVDNKPDACLTISANRPDWPVLCTDVLSLGHDPQQYAHLVDVDLLSAGMPRLKAASAAGDGEERRLLHHTLDLVEQLQPRAIMLENLPDLVESDAFRDDRTDIAERLARAGYSCRWTVVNAADFGVAQNRRSSVIVALREPHGAFAWPEPELAGPPTVGQVLGPSMASRGWIGAAQWAAQADRVGPALVGGSDRRGGADLGPTGSKKAWAALRVDGGSLWDDVPDSDFPADGTPHLTVDQAAAIQALPVNWMLSGGKTSRYRQVGHATPPPVATALGGAIRAALGR